MAPRAPNSCSAIEQEPRCRRVNSSTQCPNMLSRDAQSPRRTIILVVGRVRQRFGRPADSKRRALPVHSSLSFQTRPRFRPLFGYGCQAIERPFDPLAIEFHAFPIQASGNLGVRTCHHSRGNRAEEWQTDPTPAGCATVDCTLIQPGPAVFQVAMRHKCIRLPNGGADRAGRRE